MIIIINYFKYHYVFNFYLEVEIKYYSYNKVIRATKDLKL